MTREELFEIWAPRDSVWTPWAKAVLFAQYISGRPAVPEAPVPAIVNYEIEKMMAVVVDLPGSQGVLVALELAQKGFRPVPLYNAIPAPRTRYSETTIAPVATEIVNVQPILYALADGAPELAKTPLAPDSPPAFLLDSGRRGLGVASEGVFDNRSVCFPTDFPSAAFLASNGIRGAVIIQQTTDAPQPDLNPTLVRWQQAGIPIFRVAIGGGGSVDPIQVSEPGALGKMWYAMRMKLGLHRNTFGGFGSIVAAYGSGG
jgi:hypothetical protein